MLPNQDLHHLVHSLSKSEKRYFRLYAQARAESPNYELLFDALLAQKVFDQAALRQRFAGTSMAKRLSAEKNQLFQLILKSLRAQNQEKDAYFKLRMLLMDVKILFDRRLYPAASRTLLKADRLAQGREDFPALLQIHIWKRRLYKEVPDKSFSASPEQLQAEFQELMARIDQYLNYYHLYDQMLFSAREEGRFRGPEKAAELAQLVRHPLLQNIPGEDAFNARHFYYQVQAMQAHFAGDLQGTAHWFHALRAWWDSHPQHRSEEPVRYKAVLANALSLNLLTENFEDFEAGLEAYRQATAPNLHDAFRSQQQLFYLESIYLLNRLPADSRKVDAIAKWLRKEAQRVMPDFRASLEYHLGAIYLLLGQAGEALRWFKHILNGRKTPERRPTWEAVQLLRLAAHCDLGHFDLLIDQISNLRRSLKRREKALQFESTVLDGLESLIELPVQEHHSFRQEMGKKLRGLNEDPEERNAPGLNELIRWAEKAGSLGKK